MSKKASPMRPRSVLNASSYRSAGILPRETCRTARRKFARGESRRITDRQSEVMSRDVATISADGLGLAAIA